MKRLRHRAILELIRAGEISSQEELMRGLRARDIEVSQSTLSRDIQELKLAKSAGAYTVVDSEPPRPSEDSLRRIIRDFLVDIDVAQNTVVVKTGSGHASSVSAALEEAGLPDSLGSIAGKTKVIMPVRS